MDGVPLQAMSTARALRQPLGPAEMLKAVEAAERAAILAAIPGMAAAAAPTALAWPPAAPAAYVPAGMMAVPVDVSLVVVHKLVPAGRPW